MKSLKGISPSHSFDNSRLLGSIADNMSPPVFTRQQISCKLGSSTVRFQTKFVSAVALIGCGTLLLLYVLVPSSRTTSHHLHSSNNFLNNFIHPSSDSYAKDESLQGTYKGPQFANNFYNSTYPLTEPIVNIKRGTTRFRVAVVSDLDTNSKDPDAKDTWNSYIKKGYLEINKDHSKVQMFWEPDMIKLKTKLSYDGRGLELSELVVFNGKLYSVDDRTGVVYHIDLSANTAVPWVILNDGDGHNEKGFKSEWATVRNGLLYVGGLGKEWTSQTGELINFNPQWIKIINPSGHIESRNWTDNYIKLRGSQGIYWPGYMIHEAVCWSSVSNEWVFLPRKVSKDRYVEKTDEHRGSDLMLFSSPDFLSIRAEHAGTSIDTHGFSSFKFVPGTNENIIIALKSEEVDSTTASYILAFDRRGNILMPETKLGDKKFEGIEFV